MEIYMKGFTVASKLTCTDFLQMLGHLEKEKYQRSPHASQNVCFPSAERGPVMLPLLGLYQGKPILLSDGVIPSRNSLIS